MGTEVSATKVIEIQNRGSIKVRTPRQRVFRVTVNGTDQWTEQAGSRTVLEFQHRMATEMIPGAFVRVEEQYIGGAKAPLYNEEEGDQS